MKWLIVNCFFGLLLFFSIKLNYRFNLLRGIIGKASVFGTVNEHLDSIRYKQKIIKKIIVILPVIFFLFFLRMFNNIINTNNF